MSLISFSPSVEVQLSVWHLQVLGFMFHYTLKDGNMKRLMRTLSSYAAFLLSDGQQDTNIMRAQRRQASTSPQGLFVFITSPIVPPCAPLTVYCLTATFVLAK